MIAIVDYGVGNLFSLKSSFAAIGEDAFVTSSAQEIRDADKILLPGVGAFEDAAKKLRQSGLADVVCQEVEKGKLLLGICLGMQVAVWATNVPEWYISFWAATKIGAVLVTVNTAYKRAELLYLLKQSDTHTLIMIENNKDNSYKDTVLDICPELLNTKKGDKLHSKELPFLRNVITVGFEMPGCLTFEEAIELSDKIPQTEMLRI